MWITSSLTMLTKNIFEITRENELDYKILYLYFIHGSTDPSMEHRKHKKQNHTEKM